jgi:phosphoribosylanthranilate isomerase
MTWVKVCGLSRPHEVAAAVAAGADAVGLNLIEASPRCVSIEQAAALAVDLPVTSVVLTMDLTAEQLLDVATRVGATAVQPYGGNADTASLAAVQAGLMVLRPVDPAVDPAAAAATAPQIPVFDHREDGKLGGTGRSFDWSVLAGFERDFVLAGGLGPANVAGAVRLLRPWGVDASSGLESSPGVKDPDLIAAFVEEAKRA